MKRLQYILIPFLCLLILSGCDRGSETSSHGEEEHSEEGHHHDEGDGEISLTQVQMDAVGIRLGAMERRDMSEVVNASGTLEVDARDESAVVPRLSGRLLSLSVVDGQKVSKGQQLAVVESPEMLTMYQEYQDALKETEMATMECNRQEQLASQGAGVRKNLDNARMALSAAQLKVSQVRERMNTYGMASEIMEGKTSYAVLAEKSGTVTGIQVSPGDFLSSQSSLMKIVNTDDLFCMLALQEKDISVVKVGMQVELNLTTAPDVRFSGVVADITPILDRATRTVPVRVSLSGSNPGELIPGMAVTAHVSISGNSEDVLPEEAVVASGGKYYIFVLEDVHTEGGDKEYHFEKCEVICGTPSFGFVAVSPLEPLEPDSQIVVKGAFYLNSMVAEHGEHNH